MRGGSFIRDQVTLLLSLNGSCFWCCRLPKILELRIPIPKGMHVNIPIQRGVQQEAMLWRKKIHQSNMPVRLCQPLGPSSSSAVATRKGAQQTVWVPCHPQDAFGLVSTRGHLQKTVFSLFV
jgi:hypothetical protein